MPNPNNQSTASSRQVFSVVNLVRQMAAQQAAELVGLARDAGEQALVDGKNRAAQQLSNVGGAVRRAADKLHDQDNAALAEYVDGAADRVEQAAQHIDERNLIELAHEAGALARQKPVLFLGGLFVAGVATAQLLRTMNQRADKGPVEAAPPGTPLLPPPGAVSR